MKCLHHGTFQLSGQQLSGRLKDSPSARTA